MTQSNGIAQFEQRRPLQTVNQYCKENPWCSLGGIRWLLFNRSTNGFNKCVVKIGRRVLINPTLADTYFNSKVEAPAKS